MPGQELIRQSVNNMAQLISAMPRVDGAGVPYDGRITDMP